MSDKKTEIGCRLIACGTDKANAKAIDDLKISDPEQDDGAQAIQDAIKEGSKDGDKTGNS